VKKAKETIVFGLTSNDRLGAGFYGALESANGFFTFYGIPVETGWLHLTRSGLRRRAPGKWRELEPGELARLQLARSL